MKVAYLGPAASFTHSAASKAFPNEDMYAKNTIPDCIMAIEKGEVDIAVVPIENTIEGSVNITLDYLFHFSKVPVVAEIVLPISQHIMVHPVNKSAWKSVQKVMSHPQALAQCHTFLQAELFGTEQEVMPSTAYAAKYVSEHPDELVAAIAPLMAAENYGLEIVKKDAQDLELNQTRFFVLSRSQVTLPLVKSEEKTTITFILPQNLPGSLHKVLSTFAWRNIDMSRIESRPLKTSLGEYFFFVDLLSGGQTELVENALREIELIGGQVRSLGTYHVYRLSKDGSV